MDLFARPLPTFNIQGAHKVSSCVGFSLSATLYLLILGYTACQLVVLFGDGNPTFSTYEIENELDLDHKINLNEYGFQLAF